MICGAGAMPDGVEFIAGENKHFRKVCGTVIAYTAEHMREYGVREAAAAQERCAIIAADMGRHDIAEAIRAAR
jgi:hypothetical protein